MCLHCEQGVRTWSGCVCQSQKHDQPITLEQYVKELEEDIRADFPFTEFGGIKLVEVEKEKNFHLWNETKMVIRKIWYNDSIAILFSLLVGFIISMIWIGV